MAKRQKTNNVQDAFDKLRYDTYCLDDEEAIEIARVAHRAAIDRMIQKQFERDFNIYIFRRYAKDAKENEFQFDYCEQFVKVLPELLECKQYRNEILGWDLSNVLPKPMEELMAMATPTMKEEEYDEAMDVLHNTELWKAHVAAISKLQPTGRRLYQLRKLYKKMHDEPATPQVSCAAGMYEVICEDVLPLCVPRVEADERVDMGDGKYENIYDVPTYEEEDIKDTKHCKNCYERRCSYNWCF